MYGTGRKLCGNQPVSWLPHAIEQTQLRRKYRVDGVGRPKFDFHTGVCRVALLWFTRDAAVVGGGVEINQRVGCTRSAVKFDFYTGGRSFPLIVVRCSSTTSGWWAPLSWSSPSRSRGRLTSTRTCLRGGGTRSTGCVESNSELGYPEIYCRDLRQPERHRADAGMEATSRHRADAVTRTTSRRWRAARREVLMSAQART